jgi:uncharacterized protein YecE (DUF72 family)
MGLRPPAFSFAFEVRHASWYTEETYSVLRQHGVALCLAETDEQTPPEILTANFTYLRLRREEYTPAQLADWRKRIDHWTAQGIDVYAYIKHEDAGKGPAYAKQLLGQAPSAVTQDEAPAHVPKPRKKRAPSTKKTARK